MAIDHTTSFGEFNDFVSGACQAALETAADALAGLIPVTRDHRDAVETVSGSCAGASCGCPTTPEGWVEWLQRDPEAASRAFWENYRDLPQEVRNDPMVQVKLGQAVQEVNRFYATLSNLITASHETSKAAIQNLRV